MNIKQVPFTQGKNQGCGYYLLANLFNDQSMIEGVDMSQPIRIEHMNLQLRDKAEYNHYFVDIIWLTNSALSGTASFLNVRNGFELLTMCKPVEKKAVPLMVSIINSKGNKHMVLVLMDADMNVWLVDPLEQYVMIGNANWLLKSHHIVGIAVLGVHTPNNTGIATFKVDDLSHII